MNPNHDHDLFWLAFRYAHDELTLQEAEAFEETLARDQSAREAVACVVELGETVRAALLETSTVSAMAASRQSAMSQSAWMQPVGWLALGAAACLAAVMTFQTWQPNGSKSPAGNANLALAWAQTQADLPGELEDMNDDAIAFADDAALGEDLEAEHLPPSWMLAAVSGTSSVADPTQGN